MILPDINLLIYAYQPASAQHDKARAWWEERLNGPEGVGLPHEVTLGFVRIATHPKLGSASVSLERAVGVVNTWFRAPSVRVLLPEADHADRVFDLLQRTGSSGILTSDASLAVYAIRNRAVLYSNDSDFGRFPGLEWMNPLRE